MCQDFVFEGFYSSQGSKKSNLDFLLIDMSKGHNESEIDKKITLVSSCHLEICYLACNGSLKL